MKILLLPASYAPVLGGLQTVVQNLAQQFLNQGYDVCVVMQRYPRNLSAREEVNGVSIRRILFLRPRIEYLRSKRFDLFFASLYFFPLGMVQLVRIFQTFKPDVVNVHFPDSQIPFVLMLKHFFAFRLVVSLHGHDILRYINNGEYLHSLSRFGRQEQLRQLLYRADAVTACSNWLLQQAVFVEPSIISKSRVINNGIDIERFKLSGKYYHSRFYVLAYGRLVFAKGFDLLLEAFSKVIRSCSDVDLILAGEGVERENLKILAERLRIADRVVFPGRASPEQIVEFLNGCKSVVIPSRWEPFGIVALEALAAGKPILATNVGGLPEILMQPGIKSIAELVEPDVPSLAEGLRHILSHSSIPIADNSECLQRFSWENVTKAYEQVLQGA